METLTLEQRAEARAWQRAYYTNIDTQATAALVAGRADSAVFARLILRDEETGAPITMDEKHLDWHAWLEDHNRMLCWAHPESGKTQQLAIAYVLWRLGRNPRERWAVLSATERGAKKIIGSIAGHIEKNPMVRSIFPHLKRGKLWTDTAITVDRPYGIKDPSVQCTSPSVANIQGARLDGLIVDDVLTENNTRTPYQRQKLETWVRSSAISRLGDGAPVIFLANSWHPDDMAHVLEREGWPTFRHPVLDARGDPAWPERWPRARIEDARALFGPLEFERQMMCKARDDSSARCKAEWVDACKARGAGYRLYRSAEDFFRAEGMGSISAALRLGAPLPAGYVTVTGVDLAVSKKTTADETAIFTLMVWPDGTRQPLDLQAGRYTGQETIRRLFDTVERFRSIAYVENNGAQDFLLQWARKQDRNIPIRSFRTGRNKLNAQFGVESLFTEFANEGWAIPCELDSHRMEPQVAAWAQECLYYDPSAHTGDRLMASWIAREGARALTARRRGAIGARVIGGRSGAAAPPE